MSIAVSAIVQPSRLLIAMVGAISALVSVFALLVASGHIGQLPFVPRLALGTAAFFLSLFGFYHGVRDRKTIQLDISGTGLIRLIEMGDRGSCMNSNWPHVRYSGEQVRLMRTSTIWPNLLILRFQSDDGKTTILPILPGCVASHSFRAISVACRWIAAQNQPSERKRR